MALDKFIQSGASTAVYPLIEQRDTRIQVIFAPPPATRYGMALYDYGFWCVYVLLHEDEADRLIADLSHEIVAHRLDYLAPAGKMVTWMGPTQTGKLSVPIQLLPADSTGDYWVGRKVADLSSAEGAIEFLTGFEEKIRTILDQ